MSLVFFSGRHGKSTAMSVVAAGVERLGLPVFLVGDGSPCVPSLHVAKPQVLRLGGADREGWITLTNMVSQYQDAVFLVDAGSGIWAQMDSLIPIAQAIKHEYQKQTKIVFVRSAAPPTPRSILSAGCPNAFFERSARQSDIHLPVVAKRTITGRARDFSCRVEMDGLLNQANGLTQFCVK